MQCQAKSKQSGERCKKDAVEGVAVCHIHGGKSIGQPITTGRYSLKHRASLEAKAQQFIETTAPGDLTGELALMRTLLQDYLERFPEGMPMSLEVIESVYRMLDGIGRTVERIAKILNQTALTQAEVQLLQVRLVELATKYVSDEQRNQFFSDLEAAFVHSSGAGQSRQIATTDAP
jgi:hypothetical protein